MQQVETMVTCNVVTRNFWTWRKPYLSTASAFWNTHRKVPERGHVDMRPRNEEQNKSAYTIEHKSFAITAVSAGRGLCAETDDKQSSVAIHAIAWPS